MTKNDLKYGNVVETRNGIICVFNYYVCYGYSEDTFMSLNQEGELHLQDYNDDLTNKYGSRRYDVIKVYKDFRMKELLWEREKISLTEIERSILESKADKFKYIVRSRDNRLVIGDECPFKFNGTWFWKDASVIEDLNVLEGTFSFIKADDGEPYSIDELLK